MKIKPNFNVSDIKKAVQEKLDRIEAAIINRLKFIGETFVKNARENANFTDRTGNLRSSIGYVILKNGERLEVNVAVAGNGTDGKKGIDKAETALSNAAGNFPKGFVLIVVAGMEYAAAVESKNFDVVSASSLIAEDELKKAIEALNGKITQMQ